MNALFFSTILALLLLVLIPPTSGEIRGGRNHIKNEEQPFQKNQNRRLMGEKSNPLKPPSPPSPTPKPLSPTPAPAHPTPAATSPTPAPASPTPPPAVAAGGAAAVCERTIRDEIFNVLLQINNGRAKPCNEDADCTDSGCCLQDYCLCYGTFTGGDKDKYICSDGTAPPLSSKPAATSPTPAPASPTAAPATPTPAPVSPTSAPASPTPAPASPTPAPANPTLAPTTPTPAPTVSAGAAAAICERTIRDVIYDVLLQINNGRAKPCNEDAACDSGCCLKDYCLCYGTFTGGDKNKYICSDGATPPAP